MKTGEQEAAERIASACGFEGLELPHTDDMAANPSKWGMASIEQIQTILEAERVKHAVEDEAVKALVRAAEDAKALMEACVILADGDLRRGLMERSATISKAVADLAAIHGKHG
jgi:hypothetical protein